ncbi:MULTISPECIES: YopT-type cysteine protease domain-containing protein [Bradyrhizobium]|uniref:C58 family peptidase n=2 Tax=Bradyrhizobium quebecense TaxID=2748629 RepID=A0A939LH14_9BRAD|nr:MULTISPECIES: YopT-type cysteine protease domain-containing protein [Bradyrhizobium]UFX44218.1 YopT-type cysteine protease domain-containing protein [Bradyrhizobium sp. 41S5]UGA44384.1 YopT-type cysteine protease domain-containing protein [Bradyrhizobium quebecense]UGY00600.1 YopT-type cysteine protease domain-containing protein [Bradyrhizobium quebecense]
MYDRISSSSTRTSQADELSQSVDSGSFTETLAHLSPQWNSQPGELPDKRGACCSKPHTSDENDVRTSSASDPSTSAPESPATSLFDYRTADLRDANVDGICVGLTAEWFRNLNNSPPTRMRALTPGSQTHASAAERQQQYQNLKDQLRSRGADSSHADLRAQNAILEEAGLEPAGEEKRFAFGKSSNVERMVNEINKDRSNHLLSLYFAEGGAHTVATSASNGTTTLFDPNFGEFTVRSDPNQMASLLQSLADRYRNPNGQHLSTITTQRMQ